MDGFGRSLICDNLNECELESHNCHASAVCSDTFGSFECDCLNGFTGDGTSCVDTDECLTDGFCGDNSICINIIGGANCVCEDGYTDSDGGCTDIDECANIELACGNMHTCTNTVGSFECGCDDGWFAIPGINDGECTDIDECVNENFNDCDVNAVCNNIDGSYECECIDGFTGDGLEGNCVADVVVAIDECAEGTHDCDLTTTVCEDTDDSFVCNCKPRYIPTSAANACAFDNDSCDSKADLGVNWKGTNKCKFGQNFWSFVSGGRSGTDAASIKCKVNGIAETADYTGFAIFAKKYCGTDFISGRPELNRLKFHPKYLALADGRIQFDVADFSPQYTTFENLFYRNEETSSLSSTTAQWM